jgi:radical SAM enzyme (TIGR01210 family)
MDPQTNLLVSPSGSFLDDWEVPGATRREILGLVSALPWRQFLFETQANFVSDQSLVEIRSLLGDRPVKVVLGLESFDEHIRHLCINKDLPQSMFLEAVERIHHNKMETSINVLIGAPFLSTRHQIDDVLSSIAELCRLGVSEIFLFPVNIKVGTLVHWLWERGLYDEPSLWALVHIILRAPPDAQGLLSFAWHRVYYAEMSDVARKVVKRPEFAGSTGDEIEHLSEVLEGYLATRDRSELASVAEKSDDYRRWLETIDADRSVSCDYGSILKVIAGEILGREWLVENIAEIEELTGEFSRSVKVA